MRHHKHKSGHKMHKVHDKPCNKTARIHMAKPDADNKKKVLIDFQDPMWALASVGVIGLFAVIFIVGNLSSSSLLSSEAKAIAGQAGRMNSDSGKFESYLNPLVGEAEEQAASECISYRVKFDSYTSMSCHLLCENSGRICAKAEYEYLDSSVKSQPCEHVEPGEHVIAKCVCCLP